MDRYKQLVNYVGEVTKLKDITTRCREREYIVARTIVAVILRHNTKLSLVKIGHYIKRDHANVLHLLKKSHEVIHTDIFKQCDAFFEKTQYIKLEKQIIGNLKPNYKEIRLEYELNDIKTKYYNLTQATRKNKELIDMVSDLTDAQIETFKVRLAGYVRICQDQNKRNKRYVDNYEHNNKSYS